MKKTKSLVMIGTGFTTMGGISSVVNVYRAAGLFERYPVVYIATHCDGGPAAKLRLLCSAWMKFIGMLVSGRIGMIHVHVSRRASFWRKALFFLPAYLWRVPALLHLHSGAFHEFYARDCGPVRRWLVRYIFDHAAQVVVLSNTWKSWAQGISRNPHIAAIYNPVLLTEQPYAWSARVPGETLFFGRLGNNKGSYDLVQAVHTLAAAHPQLQLRLGGDGELEQTRCRAEALGVADRVQLLGWVTGADKARCLASATVYALPSYNEGLPMSVLEAMAAGVPVLTTPVGGIPEAVTDGVEGFLITPGDVGALAQRWSELLLDPALAERMGGAARRKVETTFSTQAVLPQLELIYRRLGVQPV